MSLHQPGLLRKCANGMRIACEVVQSGSSTLGLAGLGRSAVYRRAGLTVLTRCWRAPWAVTHCCCQDPGPAEHTVGTLGFCKVCDCLLGEGTHNTKDEAGPGVPELSWLLQVAVYAGGGGWDPNAPCQPAPLFPKESPSEICPSVTG